MPRRTPIFALILCLLMTAAVALASTTGSITGIVTDASGAVVPDATVTATNEDTGVASVVKTDSAGFYNFPNLLVGNYDLSVEQKGFKSYTKTAIRIDANTVFRVDVKLEIGEISEKVTVESDAVQVDTQSTQMGEVINSQKIESVPLNGRSFIDLLSLQPGVVPGAYSMQAAGLNDRSVSGDLGSGNQSVNGGREASNGFMINGANVNEGKNNGTAVIPNLDSIEEFRIITNNFDAEYGNYSGGQVNVVTKSGTNGFHGDIFEFNRNTAFNAVNYFAQSTPKYIQNQFGATFGGPIIKDKVFFFIDYQGTRQIQGQISTANVPDGTFDPAGDYALSTGQLGTLDGAYQSFLAGNSGNGVVQGDSWASMLSGRLGYNVANGEPYYFQGCNSTNTTSGCVFANGVIPKAGFSTAAVGLLPYIPTPNVNNPNLSFNFSDSSQNNTLRDDKGGARVDFNTRWGQISGYFHIDDANLDAAYPNGGASVPGFGAGSLTRGQVAMISDTKSFGSTAVNEFRFSYLRSANQLFTPEGGLGVSLESLGFPGGFNGNGGIGPINPAYEGVPSINFNNFAIGVPSDTTRQYNNLFQLQDNFTKIIGTHSLKFGGQFHYDQINDRNYYGENGQFGFGGGESGLDFADFLIGAPDYMIQASQQLLDSRTKYAGLYAQDSWRVTPNLTLNYGVRWDMIMPWYDTGNKIETLIPGEQSIVFPGAPTGWVVPGDPHVPRTLAPTQYHNFSPRLGIAYSPSWDSGVLAKLTGGPGKTSIRAGYGMFYTSVEDLTQFQEIGDPPYGLFYVSPAPPVFETPYIDRGSGNNEGQRFPFVFPPKGVSAKNPDTTFNWAGVLPISGALAYQNNNVTPYSEDYEFSLQRQFGSNAVLSVNYVGTQGHHLITEREANPGNQQLCLQITQILGSANGCGPFGEGGSYTLPLGQNYPSAATPNVQGVPASNCGTANLGNNCVVNTTYTVLGPDFGNNPFEATIAQSSYNSLQVSLRQSGKYGNYLLGYTYSKCIDDASGLQEGVNPFDPKASLSWCAFNVTHNFVASYDLRVPFDQFFHTTERWSNALAGGWSVSGITTFATGLPVSISENDDNSLTGTQNTEAPFDLPDYTPGPLLTGNNPRKNLQYFNFNNFSAEPLGSFGSSPRRFFSGPGLNNWDLAILKDTKITETKMLQIRFEAFNAWNHTQFQGPSGAFNSRSYDQGGNQVGGFGFIGSANAARVLQVGAKIIF